jgi:hypothetical protein
MGVLCLNGVWRFRKVGEARWLEGRVPGTLRRYDGAVLDSGAHPAEVGALATALVAKLDFAGRIADPKEAYLQYELEAGAGGTDTVGAARVNGNGDTGARDTDSGIAAPSGIVSRGTVMFVPAKHFRFMKPHISAEISDAGERVRIRLVSDAFAKFEWCDRQRLCIRDV